MKKVCIIGTGYVGLVTGVCFERLGHKVTCVDVDQNKVNDLTERKCPIYEKDLPELLKKAQNLSFTTNLKKALQQSEIVFICVQTPENNDGTANLTYVFNVCEEIKDNLRDSMTVVIKSTLPVNAVPKIREILDQSKKKYKLASNPEFLAQGTAVKDFLKPDRVVVGSDSEAGYKEVAALYSKVSAPILKTNIVSAIMVKYASNAFLATKVSFINSIARLCEKVGANISDVANGMGYDKRIGKRFLKAGIGYGGSCFPKDTKALIRTAEEFGMELSLLKAVDEINKTQRQIVIDKLKKHLGTLEGKNLCLYGLAFKPGTDDLREAPSLYLAQDLAKLKSRLNVFDPIVKAVKSFNGQLTVCDEPYEAAKNADAIVFVTEHPEFKNLDFNKIKGLAKGSILIDGRNFLNCKKLEKLGFIYEGIGV